MPPAVGRELPVLALQLGSVDPVHRGSRRTLRACRWRGSHPSPAASSRSTTSTAPDRAGRGYVSEAAGALPVDSPISPSIPVAEWIQEVQSSSRARHLKPPASGSSARLTALDETRQFTPQDPGGLVRASYEKRVGPDSNVRPSWYRFRTDCDVQCVQIVHARQRWGRGGRSGTHLHQNPLGWGAKGRRFKIRPPRLGESPPLKRAFGSGELRSPGGKRGNGTDVGTTRAQDCRAGCGLLRLIEGHASTVGSGGLRLRSFAGCLLPQRCPPGNDSLD
jgi:hypothetical protein